jgi:hypothetical protein
LAGQREAHAESEGVHAGIGATGRMRHDGLAGQALEDPFELRLD